MAVTVISQPSNDINASFSTTSTFDSDTIIGYVWINVEDLTNDTYINVAYNSQTIRLDVVEECRYTPTMIMFQSKEGVEQILHFFKKRVDKMDVTSEMFQADNGQPSLGNHEFTKFNVNAKSGFTVNSGFVSEDLNESFKRLFLSERIYEMQTSTSTIPLNITSTSFEYKTRQNDRLINYQIEFEYAYNEINTI